MVIDEAYVDFGGESAVPLIADHPNLLVVQTMSKSRALAGLRVGYALGDAGLIEALRRVQGQLQFVSARARSRRRALRLRYATTRISARVAQGSSRGGRR